ncbi:hypothetical protein C3L33_23340, partial [Rhododendron williamsianum]
MDETESRGDSSRLLEDITVNEKKYKSVYFRTETSEYDEFCGYRWTKNYSCQWHAVEFISSDESRIANLPSTIQNMPPLIIRSSAIAVPFDSNIYLIGGVDWKERSITAFRFDTNRPECGWTEIPRMLIGREKPSAVGCNGKLYVIGATQLFPQAETFDPETYEWIPLHEPPWKLKTVGKLAFKDDRSDTQFMFVESRGPGAKMKRLITYDVNTRSWDRFEVERTPKLGLTEAAIAFKGIVYWYSKTQNNLLAYDLGKRDWFRSPVSGMEVALPQSNDDDTHVWMLHLGGEKMCLVWHVLRQGRVTVNCTTFRAVMALRDAIKRHLKLPHSYVMEYKPHDASLCDNSSYRNTSALTKNTQVQGSVAENRGFNRGGGFDNGGRHFGNFQQSGCQPPPPQFFQVSQPFRNHRRPPSSSFSGHGRGLQGLMTDQSQGHSQNLQQGRPQAHFPSAPPGPPSAGSAEGTMKEVEEKTTNLFSLPFDVELEILLRLPAETLLRLKCVSKQWRTTVESVCFRVVQSRILMCFTDSQKCYMYSASLQGGAAIHHLTLPGCDCRMHGFPCGCSVSESVNGLQIIASEIFTLRTDPSSREIFALDTNSWTSVTGFPFFILFESKSVCLHGALHWKGSRNEGKSFSLVAFDLGSEEFRLITPPEEIARLSCLTKVRGCLALLDYENSDGIDMWVLEDYENNLWMKESIKWRPYPKKVGNPISFGNESSDEMLLTPNVMSHEYILCPYHLKKE